jgi:hypothetical protein
MADKTVSDGESRKSDRKRRYSDSTEPCSIASECKRLCSSGENTPGSSLDVMDLPPRLSNWERKHIEDLNISILYVPNARPLDLIQCGEIDDKNETDEIVKLKKYVQRSRIMANLGSLGHSYTCFSELSSESLWPMAADDDENISMIPPGVLEQHMIWFYRYIYTHLYEFCSYKGPRSGG